MYGKIYEQTFTGSMVGNGSHVFAVWSYVIAHTKPDSLVELNPTILATVLGDTVDHIQAAIDLLASPDESSRSKIHEGRRLVSQGPFIYFVPNYAKYRGLPNNASRRQYFSEKQRERRERLRKCQTDSSNLSKNVKQAEAISSTHKAEEEVPPNPLKGESTRSRGDDNKKRGTQKDIEEFCVSLGFPRSDGEAAFNKWEGNGWTNGGKPIRDWRATIRSWSLEGYLASQKRKASDKPAFQSAAERKQAEIDEANRRYREKKAREGR
jgi:hypothetical protein